MWNCSVSNKPQTQTPQSTWRLLQMVRAVLSDGLLFTLPPPGLTVSTCKVQGQRPLSWCVFTRLADSQRRGARGRNEAERLGANHIHFSCPAKSPVEERFKNRDKSITFAYDSYRPGAVSLLEVLLSLFFERGNSQTMRAFLLLTFPSGNFIFSSTDNWRSAGVRLLYKFTCVPQVGHLFKMFWSKVTITASCSAQNQMLAFVKCWQKEVSSAAWRPQVGLFLWRSPGGGGGKRFSVWS